MTLQGQTVLVTGGGQRLGRAIALALAERGAPVAVHFQRSGREARDLVRELGNAQAFQADLSEPEAIARLAAEVGAWQGPVRVLVNNAASFERQPFGGVSAADWDRQMAVNVRAPFLLAQALASGMQEAGGGTIINLLDVLSEHPIKGYAAYTASKAALAGLTRQLARELAPRIRVNGLALGPMLAEAGLGEAASERIGARLPLQRWGTPEEVARAVVFLAEGATFATGAIWTLDGGMSLV